MGVGIPTGQLEKAWREAQMSARLGVTPSDRRARAKRLRSRWDSLFGERLGKKKGWKCTFCGVIGSHRRGCHYVTEAHHRPRKRIRRGMLGLRARARTGAKGVIA